jgi:hypothetical protein
MTGSLKVELSVDPRKYQTHQEIVDIDGNPVLDVLHNYITIRGYYNGPDEWVSRQEEASLFIPVDLLRAVRKNIITDKQGASYLEKVKERLHGAGYDGSILKSNDLLLAMDSKGQVMKDKTGEPDLIICNFETLWKVT